MLCSSCYIDYICDFRVCNQNEFSDHNPIDFNIKTAHLRISDQIPDTNVKMVWNPDSEEDFVNVLHNENVIDSLKYMVEMIENISEEDVSQCLNDANFVFTKAVRKAADPLFKRELRNERRVSSKGRPDWADEEWSQSKKDFSDLNIKEMDLQLIELIWYQQESITNCSAGHVKQLSSITKPKSC